MIAICVGHSRKGDSGAVSVGKVTEWTYNRAVAYHLGRALDARGIPCKVWARYEGNSYFGAMEWLALELRKAKATAAIELHFNSATSDAKGHEWLFWHNSSRGQGLARAFKSRMEEEVPGYPSRGVKPIFTTSDRGGLFLAKTHCPAVICEPFFGSNKTEWRHWDSRVEELAEIYANAIADWNGGHWA